MACSLFLFFFFFFFFVLGEGLWLAQAGERIECGLVAARGRHAVGHFRGSRLLAWTSIWVAQLYRFLEYMAAVKKTAFHVFEAYHETC
jgi:hypothetical protein